MVAPIAFAHASRRIPEIIPVFASVMVCRDPVRPVTAWVDATDPLFALVGDVDVRDATMTRAVRTIVAALGDTSTAQTIGDSKTVSFSVFHGTALDVLNALVSAHGEMPWSFEPAEPEEVQATGMDRLTFEGSGSGLGILVRLGPR